MRWSPLRFPQRWLVKAVNGGTLAAGESSAPVKGTDVTEDNTNLEERLRRFFDVQNHALPQDSAFYEALGRAIGAWAQVEGALYGMFLAALKLPHAEPAAAAFHAIVSFQGRLRMVDSAVQFSLAGTPFLERWRRLEERIRKMEALRNSAAHFMPRRDEDTDGVLRLYLGPHPDDANRKKKAPVPIYTNKLAAMAEDFRALARDVVLLTFHVLHQDREVDAGRS